MRMRDRTAFAFGLFAVTLGGVGLWKVYGQVDWKLVTFSIPAVLILVAVGVLLLSRRPN